MDVKDTTAHTGAGDIPALIVRDSTAAAATWLDMARYSDTVGISQRYTPGGGACPCPLWYGRRPARPRLEKKLRLRAEATETERHATTCHVRCPPAPATFR